MECSQEDALNTFIFHAFDAQHVCLPSGVLCEWLLLRVFRMLCNHDFADIVDKGIVLTGGGGLLSNLDFVLRHATG